jgi:hypothetical protein
MSVIISDKRNPNYNGKLSAVNGFYRAESYYLYNIQNTYSTLATEVDIAVTFSNPGNCLGIVLNLTNPTDQTVQVRLQENVSTVWTDRATVTLTPFQIHALNDLAQLDVADAFMVPFTGGTFPYPVDTVAGKWRFAVTAQGGTSTGNWMLCGYSQVDHPFFVAWCDNQVSFTSGADCLVVKDLVTIDMDCTLKDHGTFVQTCGVICSGTNTNPDSVANLVWQNPPAAPYTLSVNGDILAGGHSGLRIGTRTSPIPAAQHASVVFSQGSTIRSVTKAGQGGKFNMFLWGQIPAVERTLLAQDAALGQNQIVTQDLTGWAAGDLVYVGGQAVRWPTLELGYYGVQSVAGNTITLTANLGGALRKAGGQVVRLNGYGISLSVAGFTALGANHGPTPQELAALYAREPEAQEETSPS